MGGLLSVEWGRGSGVGCFLAKADGNAVLFHQLGVGLPQFSVGVALPTQHGGGEEKNHPFSPSRGGTAGFAEEDIQLLGQNSAIDHHGHGQLTGSEQYLEQRVEHTVKANDRQRGYGDLNYGFPYTHI
jgi:hypothetical protein